MQERAVPNVLTAEHDPHVRADVHSALENAGFAICAAARDGFEVVRLARQHQPDLILLGLELPRLDGAEAIRRIRHERDVPIVLLTEDGDGDLVGKAIKAGALSWMRKPIRTNELVDTLLGTLVMHREDTLQRQRQESHRTIRTMLRHLSFPDDWAADIEARCFRAGRVWRSTSSG